MPLLDHDPIDPEIAASLDAIDATLAGEPVDARFADLAEIALLLSADRPEPPPQFAQATDQRVGRRFAPAAAPHAPRRRLLTWSRVWPTMTGLATVAALVVAIVVVTANSGGGSSESSSSAAKIGGIGAGFSGSSASSAPTPQAALAPTQTSAAASAAPGNPPLQPPSTGRKVVQSAQLQLSAASNRIDDVAQELYDVVGQVNGIVNNSSVTQGGPAGYANFQLSVPSATLGQTLTRLSELTYAHVVSRTDASQDITDQYGAATRALGDARALRTALLKQLANADTTAQIDSLTGRIHDADASISSDQATVNRLNHQVNYSQIQVNVNAGSVPVPVAHKSRGFTLGKASHDAGKVLMVTAGVGLIALAALTPVALIALLVWWGASALRRRRRDQALDLV
jgi:hypothetical protein